MKTFIVIDTQGVVQAAFRKHGDAIQYCHSKGLPDTRIKEAEITIKTQAGR